jgi:AmmeMemoRadiSam system protein A/AmmeMemoRadiSam system protein B
MVGCAVLMPHAPILVPAVGGARGDAAKASSRAMRAAAVAVLNHRPETLVLISPHAPRRAGAFGIWANERLEGSFEQFGAPQTHLSLPNDVRLAEAIAVEAQLRNVAIWAIHQPRLDHGALVPLWFLTGAGWQGPTVIISLDGSEDGELIQLGEAITAAANQLQRRIAIIASGDMSHRLTPAAPGGFHPQAQRFDKNFLRLVHSGDYRKIRNINPELRAVAAEDAVDSTLIAVAAVDWDASGHKFLSYEGPFGVGYGVAILFAEDSKHGRMEVDGGRLAKAEGATLPQVARAAVAAALGGSSAQTPRAAGAYLLQPRGVFVTVRERNGMLRGCVGTVTPVCANLVEETWRNARLAALQDTRFPPVIHDELEDLRFVVSVVHSIKAVATADDLNPRHYGVIVTTQDGRRGLLLPGIVNITTSAEQLQVARQKGGIEPDEPVTLQRFEVDRFAEPNHEPEL